MTRDEAIKILNPILFLDKDKDEALNTAIEALEAWDKVREEIKEWYWASDKQALAKDPCVVDAMTDLFIRTINKYLKEVENGEIH